MDSKQLVGRDKNDFLKHTHTRMYIYLGDEALGGGQEGVGIVP